MVVVLDLIVGRRFLCDIIEKACDQRLHAIPQIFHSTDFHKMMGFPVFQIFSFLEAVLKFVASWICLATFYAGWRVWKKRVAFQAELKCVHCKLSRSCSQTREQWWKHGGETSTCMWKDMERLWSRCFVVYILKKCSSTFICFKSLVGNVETLMWRFLPFEIIWDFCLDEFSMRKTILFMRKTPPKLDNLISEGSIYTKFFGWNFIPLFNRDDYKL